MPWALANRGWELSEQTVIVLDHPVGSVSVQGQAHQMQVGTTIDHPVGSVTVQGQPHQLQAGLTIDHAAGSVSVQGIDAIWDGPHLQRISVTDLSQVGVTQTLADALSGVTAEIGDFWQLPTSSQDGGAVVAFGDMTFEVGPPTSGVDVLEHVLFWDASLREWHGPLDLTINDPAILAHPVGSVSIQGQTHVMQVGLSIDHQAGSVFVQGQPHTFGGSLVINHAAGAVTLLGAAHDFGLGFSYQHPAGQVDIQGQAHSFDLGVSLDHAVGTVTVTGQAHSLDVVGGPWAPDHQAASITVQGQSHEFVTRLVLDHAVGQVFVQGQAHQLSVGPLFDHPAGAIQVQGQVHVFGLAITLPLRPSNSYVIVETTSDLFDA